MKKFGVILLLAAMLTQLAACGSGAGDETEAATEATTETTETTRVQHQIPNELDFNGECALVRIPCRYYRNRDQRRTDRLLQGYEDPTFDKNARRNPGAAL